MKHMEHDLDGVSRGVPEHPARDGEWVLKQRPAKYVRRVRYIDAEADQTPVSPGDINMKMRIIEGGTVEDVRKKPRPHPRQRVGVIGTAEEAMVQFRDRGDLVLSKGTNFDVGRGYHAGRALGCEKRLFHRSVTTRVRPRKLTFARTGWESASRVGAQWRVACTRSDGPTDTENWKPLSQGRLLVTRDDALLFIRESLDDVNREKEADAVIPFSEELALFGVGSPLDSLDFVNLTVGLEERLRQSGLVVDLAAVIFDERAGQPFRSVDALAAYLATRPDGRV